MEVDYTALIQKWGKAERKGKNNPYTSHNGRMFSFIDKKESYMALRFSPEVQKELMQKFKTGPVIQYNSVMRGYVQIPSKIFKNETEMFQLLDKSLAYVSSLKPNPSKKKS